MTEVTRFGMRPIREQSRPVVVHAGMPTHRTPPWKKPRPKQTARTKLTPASLAKAKAAAKKAGRRYPNLVDNMAALRAQVAAETKKSASAKKSRRKGP